MAETMMRKIITNHVKAVNGRVLEFVGSTEMPDRDNEVIKASAWQVDQYVKNPVVQWAHNYQDPPIGKTLSIRQSQGKTIFQIEFALPEVYEFADTIFKLCKGGFLNATSVGFIPLESQPGKKDGPARTYTKVELLEISIVPVPANPDALVTARNQGLITVKDFERITKPEETDDYIRIPVADADKHKDHRIRTIDISAKDGIKALYCGEDKVILTYLFAKDHDWTMAKAEAWVKEHKDGKSVVSQGAIKDELDYLLSLTKDITLNDGNKVLANSLIPELRRLAGSDMPVEDKNESHPIRDAIAPVLKALADHDVAHQTNYKLCKDALEEICHSDLLPDGEVPVSSLVDTDKAALIEVIKEYRRTNK